MAGRARIPRTDNQRERDQWRLRTDDTFNIENLTADRLVDYSGGVFASVSNLSKYILGTTGQINITDNGTGKAIISSPNFISRAKLYFYAGF